MSRVSRQSDISTSTDGWFQSWSMTRSDVDLGRVLLCRGLGLLRQCRRTIPAGFILDGDLIASRFQVDFSPDRKRVPGQAAPIFDLDDKWLLVRLHDGPVKITDCPCVGALIRLALSTPPFPCPQIKEDVAFRPRPPARPKV